MAPGELLAWDPVGHGWCCGGLHRGQCSQAGTGSCFSPMELLWGGCEVECFGGWVFFPPPRPPAQFGCRWCHSSCHLQGCWGDAVALLPGAQAVPLLHGRPVCVEHPAPVVGLGGTRGVLADDDPPDEVIAALHVVPVHCRKQKWGQVKVSASHIHPEPCLLKDGHFLQPCHPSSARLLWPLQDQIHP